MPPAPGMKSNVAPAPRGPSEPKLRVVVPLTPAGWTIFTVPAPAVGVSEISVCELPVA